MAGKEPRYPVLLLSPSGFPPLLLAAIAEELASHGNVVVGINHTDETPVTVFADGRAVAMNPDAQAGALGSSRVKRPGAMASASGSFVVVMCSTTAIQPIGCCYGAVECCATVPEARCGAKPQVSMGM